VTEHAVKTGNEFFVVVQHVSGRMFLRGPFDAFATARAEGAKWAAGGGYQLALPMPLPGATVQRLYPRLLKELEENTAHFNNLKSHLDAGDFDGARALIEGKRT
jgi:hypothetical protein